MNFIAKIVFLVQNCSNNFILRFVNTLDYSFRLELQRVREKQKEEQVEALKLSMQTGMVSFYFFTLIMSDLFFSLLAYKSTANDTLSPLFTSECLGTSNERASPAQGRDGLSVQDWEL